ncbi:hypothetical protein [Nocardioides sp. Arc9.136]|uniref:hypothetical protein n=1 Tax=Nocardioides sp. Arc9.136 TaxID=2996826 RepID=UPI0026651B24|nr:hypothetical protein [Nocardioides sp. Arc9.136]WKN47255.1 hypothetical protein OSR43_14590 [Nocardioides sp. Arc9.136]
MGDSGRVLRTVTAGALVVTLTGCSAISDQLAGEEVDPTAATTAASAGSLLETVGWAELDGLVSVLVRNPTDRVLRRAEAVVTLRDPRGTALASTAVATRGGGDGCCTVRSLRPGATYGVYVGVDGPASEVASVDVTYRDVSWSDGAGVPEVRAEPVRIEEGPRGSVVLADVTADADVPSAVVQAVVTDPGGGLVAVVSGTWSCFAPGGTRRIFMQLFRRVPRGSVVDSVAVHPDGAVAAGCEDASAS